MGPGDGRSQINDIMSSRHAVRRHLDVRRRLVIVDALKTANHPLVPIVGADNAGFVTQLLDEPTASKGAAVTNPRPIGGAGVALALQILDGKKPAEHDRPRHPGAVGQHDRRGQGQR